MRTTFSRLLSFPVCVLLCALSSPLAAERLSIKDDAPYALSAHAQVAIAPEGMAYEALPEDLWQQHEGNSLNLGFTQETLWLRFDLVFDENVLRERQPWFLNLNSGNLRHVHYYHYVDGKLVKEVETGTSLPFAQRDVVHRTFNFRLRPTAGQHQIRLRISSFANISIAPVLSQGKIWFEANSTEQAIDGVLFGILIMLALYNLSVFLFSRDPTFLLLFFGMVAAFLWRAAESGFASQFLYPDNPQIHELVARISAAGYAAALVLFTRQLLMVSTWSPKLGRYHVFMAALLMLMVSFPIFRHFPGVGLLVIIGSSVVSIISTVMAVRRNIPGARLFATGIAICTLCALMNIGKIQGLLPQNMLTDYAGDLAIIIMGLLSSLALAGRIADERLQRKAAEAETAAKSEFLANMSHELRTPLNATVGFSDLLNHQPLNQQAREYVDKIQTASKHLLSVINDILDYSKLDAGKMQVERVAVHPDALLNHAQSMFAQAANVKGLQLNVTSANEDVWFEGDPTRLTQVLVNLTGNAIKFTEQGAITISASIDRAAEQLTFSVADTGIGMTEKQKKMLFKPFSQADASTTRKFGGSGLGLAICKQIADTMQGHLTVKSTPGKGSTFSFQIPLTETQQPISQPRKVSGEALHQDLKILLVEDNATNQLLVRRMLEKLGTECVVAENGQVAVDALRDDDYTLVFMDCQMPVLDGYAATRKIREELGLKLPIIAMTANALDGDREKCLDAGMSDYMTKPVRLKHIQDCLQRWSAQQAG